MYRQHQENIGYFVEKEFKHEFTYKETRDEWALKHGFKHEIDCGEIRFGNVKKTRAYVVINEDSGSPILETWVITKNVVFVK